MRSPALEHRVVEAAAVEPGLIGPGADNRPLLAAKNQAVAGLDAAGHQSESRVGRRTDRALAVRQRDRCAPGRFRAGRATATRLAKAQAPKSVRREQPCLSFFKLVFIAARRAN